MHLSAKKKGKRTSLWLYPASATTRSMRRSPNAIVVPMPFPPFCVPTFPSRCIRRGYGVPRIPPRLGRLPHYLLHTFQRQRLFHPLASSLLDASSPYRLPLCTVASDGRIAKSSFGYDGKHLPNLTSNLGDPLMRIFLRISAQMRLRSLARSPSQVRLSAVMWMSAVPT